MRSVAVPWDFSAETDADPAFKTLFLMIKAFQGKQMTQESCV